MSEPHLGQANPSVLLQRSPIIGTEGSNPSCGVMVCLPLWALTQAGLSGGPAVVAPAKSINRGKAEW